MLPNEGNEEEIDEILDSLDRAAEGIRLREPSAQRGLAAFDSYFRFMEILDRWWKECEDENEILFFSPSTCGGKSPA